MDRYSRLEKLIGKENQSKLRKKTVCIIGLGGTGCISASLLARAGVNLIIFEPDKVEETNLDRQILFDEQDVGKFKTEVAKNKLKRINSEISVKTFQTDFTEKSLGKINCDVVIDCTDDLLTRFNINIASLKKKIPWIYCGAIKYEGMIMPISPTGKPCFKCLVPKGEMACGEETCEGVGVLGAVPNIIGGIAVSEAVKILLGKGSYGNLYKYDSKEQSLEKIKVPARKGCEICG